MYCFVRRRRCRPHPPSRHEFRPRALLAALARASLGRHIYLNVQRVELRHRDGSVAASSEQLGSPGRFGGSYGVFDMHPFRLLVIVSVFLGAGVVAAVAQFGTTTGTRTGTTIGTTTGTTSRPASETTTDATAGTTAPPISSTQCLDRTT